MAKNVMDLRESYTQTLDIDIYPKGENGKDGKSITSIVLNDQRHLICTMSDGTIIDAGRITLDTGNFDVRVVEQLPTENISLSTVYCIASTKPSTTNKYNEFVYVNSNWEQVGSTEVDLSSYYNKTEIDKKIENIGKTIEDTKIELKKEIAETSAKTIVTTTANKEGIYYLLGSNSQGGKEKTEVVNSGTSEINSGVKYVAGSEIEKGKMYIDEERVTTGLHFTIS